MEYWLIPSSSHQPWPAWKSTQRLERVYGEFTSLQLTTWIILNLVGNWVIPHEHIQTYTSPLCQKKGEKKLAISVVNLPSIFWVNHPPKWPYFTYFQAMFYTLAVHSNLVGGFKHDWIIFHFINMGYIIRNPLTFTPSFFKMVKLHHQPERYIKWIIIPFHSIKF